MIGVFVSFQLQENFNPEAIRKLAEESKPKFEGMPGLRSKAFTLDPERREATNFYVWNSDEAARAFFSEETIERVTRRYGVRPTVHFVQISALVENNRSA